MWSHSGGLPSSNPNPELCSTHCPSHLTWKEQSFLQTDFCLNLIFDCPTPTASSVFGTFPVVHFGERGRAHAQKMQSWNALSLGSSPLGSFLDKVGAKVKLEPRFRVRGCWSGPRKRRAFCAQHSWKQWPQQLLLGWDIGSASCA